MKGKLRKWRRTVAAGAALSLTLTACSYDISEGLWGLASVSAIVRGTVLEAPEVQSLPYYGAGLHEPATVVRDVLVVKVEIDEVPWSNESCVDAGGYDPCADLVLAIGPDRVVDIAIGEDHDDLPVGGELDLLLGFDLRLLDVQLWLVYATDPATSEPVTSFTSRKQLRLIDRMRLDGEGRDAAVFALAAEISGRDSSDPDPPPIGPRESAMLS